MKSSDLPLIYNACTLLDDNLAQRADKVAIYSAAGTMTYRQIADQANQVGNGLKQLGVRFGECVGVLAPDSIEWVTSFFGISKIGAITVCMNTLLQTSEYDYILRDSRLGVLIVHESLLKLIEPLRGQHSTLKQIVVIGRKINPADFTFTEWLQNQSTDLATESTHRDDFCSLHYSSGTTGQPKGMFHAHKDYPLIAQNTGQDLLSLTEEDRTFAVAKLFFVYGLGGNLVMPFYAGASIILYAGSPRFGPAVLDTINRFQRAFDDIFDQFT